MASKRRKPGPVATRKTVRLRKIECDAGCGYVARVSARWLSTGLPACPCGGTLWPAELEDAVTFLSRDQLEDHPAWREYVAEIASVQHGQAPSGRSIKRQANRAAKGTELRQPELVAAGRIHDRERICAVQRRLTALKGPDSAREAMPF